MRNVDKFTESQILLICKIHKYSRIYQLFNIRMGEIYNYIHLSITLFIIFLNLSMAILNFHLVILFKNNMNNSVVLICNTLIISMDIILSFRAKGEYYKNKSILYSNLANKIEEDLLANEIINLELNRILREFKLLVYTESQKISNYILKMTSANINQKELDDLKTLNPILLINIK